MVIGEWEVGMTPREGRRGSRHARAPRPPPRRAEAGIVVVGRGNGLRRLINGSVSTRLVRRAPCDVLVVH